MMGGRGSIVKKETTSNFFYSPFTEEVHDSGEVDLRKLQNPYQYTQQQRQGNAECCSIFWNL